MSEEKFVLPTTKRAPVAIVPNTMLIYGSPKSGKTSIAAQLQNSLLVELEPGGADFVEANVVQANNPPEFEKICKAIIEAGCQYDYVIFDTITKLDR